jgi:head-tail adaptor
MPNRSVRLDQIVQIQEKVRTSIGGGNYTELWTDVGQPQSARVVPISGSERLQAQQLEGRAMYRVTIRRREDVTTANRLLWCPRRGSTNRIPMDIRFAGSPDDRFVTMDVEVGVDS